jgi:hypothetical protein
MQDIPIYASIKIREEINSAGNEKRVKQHVPKSLQHTFQERKENYALQAEARLNDI